MSTAGSLYAIILLNALGHYLMAMQNTFLGRPDLAAAIRAAPLEGPLVSDNAFAIMANIQFDLVRSSSQLPFHGGRSYPSKTSCKRASSSVRCASSPSGQPSFMGPPLGVPSASGLRDMGGELALLTNEKVGGCLTHLWEWRPVIDLPASTFTFSSCHSIWTLPGQSCWPSATAPS